MPWRRPHRTGGQPSDESLHRVADIRALLLEAIPLATVALDVSGDVLMANRAAEELGVVTRGQLRHDELRGLVRTARRQGRTVDTELRLPGAPLADELPVRARAVPLGDGAVGLVVEDVREAQRVEAVRRDFAANVGHELKTPVGALRVLAEALVEARDDPVAVQRFVGRIGHEADRLGRLIQELIDLSRLQGAEPLPAKDEVSVDAVVEEALDRTRATAEAKEIELVHGGDTGAVVRGNAGQLATALANVVDNAVAYSDPGDRVAVAVRATGSDVEISVTDQGIGIARADLDRVFERFYRVDPARSRATGGTGLGLAIVKHTVTNHGGEVRVWSELGEGSTFTIRLPAAPATRRTVAVTTEGAR